ncbi:MAG: hypothetical protein HC893_07645 [Chloroflexaceae bacterium]|nr:hypothetical protein [Chloroflexaceae bacterium]
MDNVQLLTPPMGPGRQAEYFTQDCRRQRLFPGVGAVPIEVSGYERMLLDDPATTEIEGMLLPNFNEGYTWNNYWDPGREAWTTPNSRGEPSVGCEDIPPGNPSRTDHIYQLFPPDLQTHIQNDLSFIVETDLKSPRGPQGGTIRNPDDPDLNGSKDENNIGNAAGTANSIATFVNNEVTNGVVDFVSLWLLTVDFNADPDNAATVETGCQVLDNRDNPFLIAGREELWHQAYLPDGTECQWFRILWSRP